MKEFECECPYCGGSALCELVDNGVGMQQCGPFICDWCGSEEMSSFQDHSNATEEENKLGWWKHPDIPKDLDVRQERLKIEREKFEFENRSRLQRVENE